MFIELEQNEIELEQNEIDLEQNKIELAQDNEDRSFQSGSWHNLTLVRTSYAAG
jgi:hypothetical protein